MCVFIIGADHRLCDFRLVHIDLLFPTRAMPEQEDRSTQNKRCTNMRYPLKAIQPMSQAHMPSRAAQPSAKRGLRMRMLLLVT